MIFPRLILTILLLICLSACSENPAGTGAGSALNNEAPTSKQPVAPSESASDYGISIVPLNATAETILKLRTGKAAMKISEIRWYINGSREESSNSKALVSHDLEKGDVIHAIVIAGDKEYRSNEIKIGNTPPVISRAILIPPVPRKESAKIGVELRSNDIDGDTVTFKYLWSINGRFAGEESYLDAELQRDDMISVEVTPYDGEETGKSIMLKSKVYNSLPVVSDSTPLFDGKTYRGRIAATDPDNDKLTFELYEGPEGMTVDASSGVLTWEVKPGETGLYDAKVIVSDNHGGKILVPVTIVIGLEEKEE